MKNTIIFLILFCVIGINLKAQDAGMGVIIGVSSNSWRGKDLSTLNQKFNGAYIGKNLPDFERGHNALIDDDGNLYDNYILALGKLEPRTGFLAGFEINSELTNHFWLKHEIMFASKGFSFQGTRFDTTGTPIENNVEVRYRSYHADIMPFSLLGEMEGFQAYVGPYVSVLLYSDWKEMANGKKREVSETGVFDFNYYETNTSKSKLESRQLGILDLGLVLGLEYEFEFKLDIGVFYKYGLGRTIEAPPGHVKTSIYNNSINLKIGYIFGEE